LRLWRPTKSAWRSWSEIGRPFSSSTLARCPKLWTSSTERNKVYRMLSLEIAPLPSGRLAVRGILNDSLQTGYENDNIAGDFVPMERHRLSANL
jgi:hypothetical protein